MHTLENIRMVYKDNIQIEKSIISIVLFSFYCYLLFSDNKTIVSKVLVRIKMLDF